MRWVEKSTLTPPNLSPQPIPLQLGVAPDMLRPYLTASILSLGLHDASALLTAWLTSGVEPADPLVSSLLARMDSLLQAEAQLQPLQQVPRSSGISPAVAVSGRPSQAPQPSHAPSELLPAWLALSLLQQRLQQLGQQGVLVQQGQQQEEQQGMQGHGDRREGGGLQGAGEPASPLPSAGAAQGLEQKAGQVLHRLLGMLPAIARDQHASMASAAPAEAGTGALGPTSGASSGQASGARAVAAARSTMPEAAGAMAAAVIKLLQQDQDPGNMNAEDRWVAHAVVCCEGHRVSYLSP